MKKVSNSNWIKLFAVFIFLIAFAPGCKNKNAQQDITYTCPMHPDIIKNEASTCPICGMDLVRLHQHKSNGNDSVNLTDIILKNGIETNTKTIYPKNGVVRDTVMLNGIISINTNNTRAVSSYISGRIEKLYVTYNFQKIAKGQKVMDVYSPDLVAAQQELLYLKQAGDVSLMNQAKNKLRLLGMTDKDINNILIKEKANYSVSIYSPYNGFVLDNIKSTSKENLNSSNTPLSFRKGMYINTGDVLFKVNDNNSVWAEFSVNPDIIKTLKQHQKIEIATSENKWISAKINSIQPFYKDGQSFSNIRVQLKNSQNKFKIGELASAKINSEGITGLWIPKTAVYTAGGRTIVFIKRRNQLHPLSITTTKIGNRIMVLNGLSKTDEIAENAAHLVDPEAFINNENEKN